MSAARKWFLSKYKEDLNKTYTSKFYTPEQSWPKTNVWWLQIPVTAIDEKSYTHVNLLCQVQPNNENDFHYLKVQASFLNTHIKKFHRLNDKISLYLSAEPSKLFVEERGEGKLDFSQFLVKQ